jgi:hypothetical protein
VLWREVHQKKTVQKKSKPTPSHHRREFRQKRTVQKTAKISTIKEMDILEAQNLFKGKNENFLRQKGGC